MIAFREAIDTIYVFKTKAVWFSLSLSLSLTIFPLLHLVHIFLVLSDYICDLFYSLKEIFYCWKKFDYRKPRNTKNRTDTSWWTTFYCHWWTSVHRRWDCQIIRWPSKFSCSWNYWLVFSLFLFFFFFSFFFCCCYLLFSFFKQIFLWLFHSFH